MKPFTSVSAEPDPAASPRPRSNLDSLLWVLIFVVTTEVLRDPGPATAVVALAWLLYPFVYVRQAVAVPLSPGRRLALVLVTGAWGCLALFATRQGEALSTAVSASWALYPFVLARLSPDLRRAMNAPLHPAQVRTVTIMLINEWTLLSVIAALCGGTPSWMLSLSWLLFPLVYPRLEPDVKRELWINRYPARVALWGVLLLVLGLMAGLLTLWIHALVWLLFPFAYSQLEPQFQTRAISRFSAAVQVCLAVALAGILTVWVDTSLSQLAVWEKMRADMLGVVLDDAFARLLVHEQAIVGGAPATAYEGRVNAVVEPGGRADEMRLVASAVPGRFGYLLLSTNGRLVKVSLDDVHLRWLPRYWRMVDWNVVDLRPVPLAQRRPRFSTSEIRFRWSPPWAEGASTWWGDIYWTTEMNTFYAPDGRPLERLQVTVRASHALLMALFTNAGTAGMGLLLLYALATSLWTAERGVRRQLELADARTRFAHMVSHELRTPVAGLRLHAEMLEHGLVTDEAEVGECHHVIGEQVRRLQHLMESVLELARLERGVRQCEVADADLNGVVGDALVRLGDERPDSLRLSLDPDLPSARIDREAATQVVLNLVQNAIRHARDVEVSTSSTPTSVRVEVADRGPGIAPQDRARIFEPYVQIGEHGRGTGLGLALVRGYMEAQGGMISVHDRPGGGCLMRAEFRR